MHTRVAQLFKGYLARMANLFPGTWRVDGVTNVSGQHGSRIELRLSPLHSSHSENPYVTKALTRAPGEPFVIHTSMLSRFVVGSVWHNGQLVFLPPLEKKKPIIEPTKALYVSLDSSNKLPPHFPGELLPQSFFPMAPGNRDALRTSMYAVVPTEHPNVQFLIIPCIELLRFYFGVSSRMMTDMIRGKIGKHYADFDIENPHENDVVKVRLKKLLTRPETLVIAQALSSEIARAALFSVHNTLATRMLKNAPLDIECHFPCDGRVAVDVRGKRIEIPTADGKGHTWALFVMHLVSSSHQMNANDIDLDYDLLAAQPLRKDGNVVYMRQDKPYLDEEKTPTFNDLLKANKRIQRIVEHMPSERFPGLKNIRIHHPKDRKNSDGELHVFVPGEEVQIDTFTTGDGDYQKDNKHNRGVTEFITETARDASRVARDLDLFLETCTLLADSLKKDGWSCAVCTVNADLLIDKPDYSRFESIPSNQWTAIKGRSRYLIIFKMINEAGQHCYFLEMELKDSQIHNGQSTGLMFRTNGDPITDAEWIDYLAATSIIGRWASPKNRYHPKLGQAAINMLEKLHQATSFHLVKHPRSSKLDESQSQVSVAAALSSGNTVTSAEELPAGKHLRAYDPTFWAAKLRAELLSTRTGTTH